ncbi:hypothetical protein VNO77_03078 [Canavalia gladiata]|uniref:Uncharacterized protein n=1 Tax=Canavalia gladiata TaxID=3824 RepID=A0AAN9MUV7_CANGL
MLNPCNRISTFKVISSFRTTSAYGSGSPDMLDGGYLNERAKERDNNYEPRMRLYPAPIQNLALHPFAEVFSWDGYARNMFQKKEKESIHNQIEANHRVTCLYAIDVSLVPKATARLATMNLSPLPFLHGRL